MRGREHAGDTDQRHRRVKFKIKRHFVLSSFATLKIQLPGFLRPPKQSDQFPTVLRWEGSRLLTEGAGLPEIVGTLNRDGFCAVTLRAFF